MTNLASIGLTYLDVLWVLRAYKTSKILDNSLRELLIWYNISYHNAHILGMIDKIRYTNKIMANLRNV